MTLSGPRPFMAAATFLLSGRCRRCGCTDARACRGGCMWADGEDRYTLCTRCAAQPGRRRFRRRRRPPQAPALRPWRPPLALRWADVWQAIRADWDVDHWADY